ncbi:hypothetical protein BJ508DRAFT_320128 [Ascobolus immersus RN42]|uniref:Uncharacterized protein n=1 Tax=Ascobolus immersus RN42 TaxID=1160509 RepID=A0A3N4IQL8_ASCIM|nr:hypothetical protein BJ508DRAFT_320128 [Ascobolus immersus RN42]
MYSQPPNQEYYQNQQRQGTHQQNQQVYQFGEVQQYVNPSVVQDQEVYWQQSYEYQLPHAHAQPPAMQQVGQPNLYSHREQPLGTDYRSEYRAPRTREEILTGTVNLDPNQPGANDPMKTPEDRRCKFCQKYETRRHFFSEGKCEPQRAQERAVEQMFADLEAATKQMLS